jgi:hypothetical protein
MKKVFSIILLLFTISFNCYSQTLVPDSEITLLSGPNNPFGGGFLSQPGNVNNTYVVELNEYKFLNYFRCALLATGNTFFDIYSAPSSIGPWQLITSANFSVSGAGWSYPTININKVAKFIKVDFRTNNPAGTSYFNSFDFYESPLIQSSASTILQGNCTNLTSPASGETYLWSTGETTQSIQVCSSGVYTVDVTNSGFTGNQDHSASISISNLGSLDSLFGPNGEVYSIFRFGNTVYYGGDFNAIGQITGSAANIDNVSGLGDKNFPRIVGTVNVVIPDGSGGWYVGGNFNQVGTHLRNHLVHINANNTLDFTFNPNPNGEVYSLAISGGYLYIGGAFTTIQGTANNYAAKVFKDTGSPVFWSVNVNAAVRTIALYQDLLILGGNFTSLGGATRNFLGAVDTTFLQATAWNPNPNAAVYKLYLSGTKLYAGGDFTTVSGISKQYGCGFTLPGFTLDGYNIGANGRITDFYLSGSVLYVCGQFTTIGGASRNYLAALSSINALANTFNPSPNGIVRSLTMVSGNLVIGGDFSTVASVTRSRLAMLNTSTVTATSWDPNVLGLKNTTYFVNCLSADGNKIFAGGNFYSLSSVTRNNVAAFDETTGQLLPWNPNINGIVRAIVADSNYVYIGGNFSTVNGTILKNRIAQLNVSNGLPTGWNPNSDAVVNALALNGTTLFVGGNFANIGGSARARIAGLNTLTGAATPFNPSANAEVFALNISNNILYVGGAFTTIGAQTRNRVAAFDVLSNNITNFNPNANNTVYALSSANNNLYLGGLFTNISGLSRLNFAIFNLTTNSLSAYNPVTNSSSIVYALCSTDTVVYRGGIHSFENQNFPIINLTSHSENAPAPTYWQPNPNDTIRAIAISNSKLYVGGKFKIITNRFQPHFASVDLYTLLAPTISSITNDTICLGQNTILNGSGLSNVNGVSVGGVSVPFTVQSNSSIQITPSTTVNGVISISYGTSTATTSQNLTVISAPTTPTISANGATTICQGGTVTLTSSSATGNTWSNGATTQSIVVSSAGNYSVTVSNGSCSASSASVAVSVLSAPTTPTISANGATSFCQGGSVTLTSSSATGNTWSNGATTQSITVSAAGNYSVTVSNGSCSASSASVSVSVLTAPTTPTISANGATSFCQGESVTLTSSSATGNTWSNGATTQSITVSAAGNYSVSVSNGSCSASSASVAVTVLPAPTTPTISANGATSFCQGGSVTLTSSSATGNTWSNGATTQSITVSAAGNYSVTISNGSCTASSSSVAVSVLTAPTTPTISTNGATSFCQGGSVTLTSSSATGNTWSNGATSQSITVSAAGNYSVSVSNGSCSASSASVAVTVLPAPNTPTISANGATSFCQGGSVTLTSSSATGNTWSNGATTQSITVSAAGNYSVTVSNGSCSASSSSVVVSVLPAPTTPTISANGATSFCQGESVTLTSSSATGNTWSNGATTQSITVSAAGNYSVSVSNGSCTSSSASVAVTVLPAPTTPTISANGATSFCQGGSVTLTSSSATGNTWSNGATTQSITVSAAGNYSVSVSNGSCTASSASIAVSVLATPTVNLTTSDVTLNGGSDGSIDITVINSSSSLTYLWSNGSTTEDLTGLTAGTYIVTITDLNGCFITETAIINQSPVSVIYNSSNWFSKIYPNPANFQTTVEVNLVNKDNVQIRLINSLGQIIESVRYSDKLNIQHNLNVSELPAAIYFVEITAGNSIKIMNLSVIKN